MDIVEHARGRISAAHNQQQGLQSFTAQLCKSHCQIKKKSNNWKLIESSLRDAVQDLIISRKTVSEEAPIPSTHSPSASAFSDCEAILTRKLYKKSHRG